MVYVKVLARDLEFYNFFLNCPQIKDDLYGNVREDVTLDGYRKHVVSAAAPGPMSREEEREIHAWA